MKEQNSGSSFCSKFHIAQSLTGGTGGLGVQQQGHNQTVQTQDFGENQNQKHTDKQTGLLRGASDTSVTHNANGEAGGKSRQTDRQTSTQLDETSVKRLLLLQRVRHQHGHHKTVNGNNTGQHNWDNVLEQQVGSQHTGNTHTDTRLSGSVGGAEAGEHDSGRAANGAEKGSVYWAGGRLV